MVVPPVLAAVVATRGWQAGYIALGVVALIGIVPALTLPAGRSLETRGADVAKTAEMRSPTFILLLLSFGMMALAFAGLLPHFVPMLRDGGMDARSAGALAGVIGASVIVSRVVVGWLADRIDAPRIAATCCALCALGCLAR